MFIDEGDLEPSLSFLSDLDYPFELQLGLSEVTSSLIEHPLRVERLQVRLNIVYV